MPESRLQRKIKEDIANLLAIKYGIEDTFTFELTPKHSSPHHLEQEVKETSHDEALEVLKVQSARLILHDETARLLLQQSDLAWHKANFTRSGFDYDKAQNAMDTLVDFLPKDKDDTNNDKAKRVYMENYFDWVNKEITRVFNILQFAGKGKDEEKRHEYAELLSKYVLEWQEITDSEIAFRAALHRLVDARLAIFTNIVPMERFREYVKIPKYRTEFTSIPEKMHREYLKEKKKKRTK